MEKKINNPKYNKLDAKPPKNRYFNIFDSAILSIFFKDYIEN